jgi:hypothetical protein
VKIEMPEVKKTPEPVVVGGVYLLKGQRKPRLLVRDGDQYLFFGLDDGSLRCRCDTSDIGESIANLYTYCPDAKMVIPA